MKKKIARLSAFRVCRCGRHIANNGKRICDFCIATENADTKTLQLIDEILHNGTPPTENDYDEAHEINAEINDVYPLVSEQRERIEQPQRKHGVNRRTK